MPVNIGTHLQRPAAQADFGQALAKDLSRDAQGAKNVLADLKRYIRPANGPLREGNIRLINTTNGNPLAFAYKSAGWGPQYRKERTAQALVGLLQSAGVADAQAKVDQLLLKPGTSGAKGKAGAAAYATLTARKLDQLLSDADVLKALASDHPKGLAAGQPNPAAGGGARISSGPPLLQPQRPAAEQQRPEQPQQPVVEQQRPQPRPSQQRPPNPVAQPPQPPQMAAPMGRDPRRVLLDNFRDFKQGPLLVQAFRSPPVVEMNRTPYFFTAVQKDGAFVQFRDLSDSPFLVAASTESISDEGIYEDFKDRHPADKHDFRPPDWLVVRDPKSQDFTQAAFRLVDRKTFTEDPEYAGRDFEVWATLTVDPSRAPSNLPAVQVPKKVLSPKEQIFQFFEQQGYAVDRRGLGQGGFGATFLAQKPGKSEVLKLFIDGRPGPNRGELKPEAMTAQRSIDKASDAYATYLAKASDPNWRKPLVVHPNSYIVENRGGGEGQGYITIPIAEFKARARAANEAGAPLQCIGLVMDEAPGDNLAATLAKAGGLPGGLRDAKRMALSGLRTLESLNQRGLIHRDIKPANMNFDSATGELHFFDTGLMFKVKRTDADRKPGVNPRRAEHQRFNELPRLGVGTSGYMHPMVTWGYAVGTQADLHAFGLTLLQATYGRLSIDKLHTPELARKQHSLSLNDLQLAVDRLAQSDPDAETRRQAQELLSQANDPSTMANLIWRCMEMADNTFASPTKWADRNFSKTHLQSLINHAALAEVA